VHPKLIELNFSDVRLDVLSCALVIERSLSLMVATVVDCHILLCSMLCVEQR